MFKIILLSCSLLLHILFKTWYITEHLLAEPSGNQYVLSSLDHEHRRSWDHSAKYRFPPAQQTSLKYSIAMADQCVNFIEIGLLKC